MWDGALPPTGLLDGGEHFADSSRESLCAAHATNVHEHDLRGIPEKVVVQGSDLKAITQRHTHDWIHLVFQQDDIPHHHHLVTHLLKRGPGSEAHRWSHLDTGCRHGQVGAGDTD